MQDQAELVTIAMKLSASSSKEQREMLLELCDAAKELGAKGEQLAPIYAAIFLCNQKPTEQDIARRGDYKTA